MSSIGKATGRSAGAGTGTIAAGASKPRARRTTQPKGSTTQRWLPQRGDYKSYQEWDTITRGYTRIYELEDKLQAIAGQSGGQGGNPSGSDAAGAPSTGTPAAGLPPGSTSATHILGIAVKAGVPADGTKLTYVAAQGQFVFQ